MIKVIAKLLWLVPALLLFYSGYLVQAGFSQKSTAENGFKTVAEVTRIDVGQRAEITYGEIDLAFQNEAGQRVEETLPLPLSLLFMIRDEKTLDISYQEGASKSVMIAKIATPLWRMSLINAAMCFVAGLLLIIPVFAWNRYLKRHGDPGASESLEGAPALAGK